MSLLHFITAIPLDVRRGSGCYVGTWTLMEALGRLGMDVATVTPRVATPIYTVTRVLFNEALRWRHFAGDATIGIDADGYAIAGKGNSLPHIACIKGVLADAVRFERGGTRASIAFQAWLEAKHARRADLVITVSRYCAERMEEFYGVRNAAVVPELIDLETWGNLFRANRQTPNPEKFTVFSVCRFYPRKRLDVLLRAAALLRDRIPRLEIRIAGDGPEQRKLHQICLDLRLERTVHWLGHVSTPVLASEYNRADIFCLPSAQEGFGIVFLEAMAAGKPIVAARASAVPESVRHGILVEPGDSEALAEGIVGLYRDPDLRHSLAAAGLIDVREFEAQRVARLFLSEIRKVVPALKIPGEVEVRHAN